MRGFVSRTAELARLDHVLLAAGPTGPALVVGTAGVGKTALALRWAHRVAARFPDGQLYVNLRGYDPGAPMTADQALDRFLRALSVPPARIPDDVEDKAALYRSLLAGRRVLVVLDNAAHIGQVRPLLPGGPACRTIVTSRDRLEGVMARDGAQRVTVEVLPEADAITLIRALTTDYRTADEPGERAELARLCARLPLALRIAAERAASRPWMPLAELIGNLRDESRLWDELGSGGEHDGVRAVFALSYRSFSAEAAHMFRVLGLHPSAEFGTHVAAEAAGVPVAAARQLLDAVVGAHMLEQIGADRYQFHDLLRAYATDVAHQDEPPLPRDDARARILAWYLHTAHTVGTVMRTWGRILEPDALPAPAAVPRFPDHDAAVEWCYLEGQNLFAAIQAADESGRDTLTWQLAVATEPAMRGMPSDDRRAAITMALAAARRDGARQGEGELLAKLAEIERTKGQFDEAATCAEEALAIFRELDDRHGVRITLNFLGVSLLHRRKFAEAAERFESLWALQRAEEDLEGETAALFNLAEAYDGIRRHHDAVDAARHSVELARALGNRHFELVGLVILARATANLADAGELGVALADAARGVELARELRDTRTEGWALLDYGRIQRLAGRYDDALVSYRRALERFSNTSVSQRRAWSLDGLGTTCREAGRIEEAVSIHRQAVEVARAAEAPRVLGLILSNLADSLTVAGEDREAGSVRQEAASLLELLDDPEATERLEQVRRALP
ncbi:tetratricopeptide repeat protein [Amycolatopsis sp., V23-08]|uniref:Tetratricopeptide repeat protein n=1 Tax=Amycolatopsis heterodermiae TaxID=3110235 RepID=A0ABU5R2J1_9PSEU|nr:tetratricopeptide repeat protein [Amycolatopsis sp., V23-08]MEA5360378.1 tetratricopeptide repeat protein [Amycolatopsis sp., V23-08]